nr:putative ribonuclease H-like domain-containing protein [Tanacetum cinerariifolium]
MKREFSVPRTPQQNGIAERKNRTLIEAARTMLADSLLPIPFWAEAVNTACYVQNRVLVTKPHNKTPYELLHGRRPSIGFMRPFGCPVTILNTLDILGKFKRKVGEGFLVGYSVNSKAFRVLNSRIRIIQETLHVNFLEKKPNVADKVRKEANLQYVFFPVWSTGSLNPQNKEGDTAFAEKKHDAEKPESAVNLSPSRSALSGEKDDMTKKKDKGKSPVECFSEFRDLNAVFEDFSRDSSNDVSAASPIVSTDGHNYSNSTNLISATDPIVNTTGHNYSNSTNPISVVGPLNSNSNQTHEQSSLRDTYQPPDMVERDDIDYSDHENVGAEADFNNLETSITVSPIPTTRIHNTHPISQIIGNMSSTTQTRSMARITRDQGGISHILNEDFHTCMFACFLSQEEPKRVHQALKDPSWIEAMQEEVLQFKMQKVWILVDLPHGKRAIGHTQEEGIDYEEVFALVARIEAIRLFLAYASFMRFMVYQMDVKSTFLYGTIEEEVYVCQPPGFEDPDHLDKVYKVVKQKEDGIFINQDKYVAEILKKFGLTEGKSAVTPIDTEKPLLKDPDGKDVDVHIYRSMIGSLMYLTSSRPDIMFAFWRTVAVKSSNDVTRLRALVDNKRVMVTEAATRDALHLDDAEGVDCLPNEEIFTELARMGYEKPTTKLTFYKAFFSSQWKFLIHTVIQSMSAKSTSWNEFSPAMASAVICLSTCRKFNFSKYIFESLVRNVDSITKFYMYHRVGKGCSEVETPLFEGMLVAREPEEQCDVKKQGNEEEHGTADTTAEEPKTAVPEDAADDQPIPSPTPLTPPPQQPQDVPSTYHAQSHPLQQNSPTLAQTQGAHFPMSLLQEALDACVALARRVEHLEQDKVRDYTADTQVKGRHADIYHIDMDHAAKVLSMQEDESEVHESVDVVTNAKLITKVVVTVSETVSVAAIIPSVVPETISAAAIPTVTAPPIKVVALVKAAVPFTRRKRGVVIRDPEEESSVKNPTETTSKDKGKGILVEEPKPIKKKQQVKLDEAYARKLQEEFNQDIDWEAAIDHIVLDQDDDVFTEATPLARKVPVVDYQVILVNNKPRYKIIKANDTHQLYASFITMLKNFDREDLETLWRIVKQRFSTSKPNNFSDEYLLTALKTMFKRLDGQDNIILLVERRYPLTKFTLEQMLNVVRLQVEEESEMSLELIRFIRQQLQEAQHN